MCSRVKRGHRGVVGFLIPLRPCWLPRWGLHRGGGPFRTTSSASRCRRLGTPHHALAVASWPLGWHGGVVKALEGQWLHWAQWLGQPAPGRRAPCGRARGDGSRRVAIHPKLGATTAAMPFGREEGYRRSNTFIHTLWSMIAGMLLMLLFSGASRSCFGRGRGGDITACDDHVSCSTHIIMRLHIPCGVSCRGRRGFEVNG